MIYNIQNNDVSYNTNEIKYVTIYKSKMMRKYPLNDYEINYNFIYNVNDDIMIRIPPLSEIIFNTGLKKIKITNNSANHRTFDNNELHILLEDIKTIYGIKIFDLERTPDINNNDVEHFEDGQNMYYYVKSNFTLTNIVLFITFILILYFIVLDYLKKHGKYKK